MFLGGEAAGGRYDSAGLIGPGVGGGSVFGGYFFYSGGVRFPVPFVLAVVRRVDLAGAGGAGSHGLRFLLDNGSGRVDKCFVHLNFQGWWLGGSERREVIVCRRGLACCGWCGRQRGWRKLGDGGGC